LGGRKLLLVVREPVDVAPGAGAASVRLSKKVTFKRKGGEMGSLQSLVSARLGGVASIKRQKHPPVQGGEGKSKLSPKYLELKEN